jgi:hypothetical protein
MYPKKPIKVAWLVLDKSGSMSSVRSQTISAYNEYLQTLKNQATECELYVGLTVFSDPGQETVVGALVPIGTMVPLTEATYQTDGCTALYDAIGLSINALERAAKEKGAASFLFTIQTDGQENSSREFKFQQITKMIADRKERGNWTFTFLGANIDAYAAGGSLGISVANCVGYAGTETQQTFRSFATSSANYLNTNVGSTEDFTSFAEPEDEPAVSVSTGSSSS